MTNPNSKQVKSELKGCPFCPDGGDPYLHDMQFGTRAHDVAVRCRKCGGSANSYSWASGLTHLQDDRYAEARRKAVVAWNTRLPVDSVAPGVDVEDMTDDELRAAADFHRAEVMRYSNEGAKLWRLRVRLNGGTNEDKQRLAELHERRAAAASPAPKEEEAQGWQPIETAPKDGTEILLVWHWDSGIHKGVTVVTARWYCRTHAHKSSVRNCPNEPDCKMGWDTYAGKMTHWMPLPPAPLALDRDPDA